MVVATTNRARVRHSRELLAHFKPTGDGWQARMDGVLLKCVARHNKSAKSQEPWLTRLIEFTTMHAVAYVSSATQRLATPQSIDRLLTGACSFNQACGVTGVLLHQDGNFFQYLEGPPEGVAQVYARVKRATSHHGLIELLNGPVEQRHFSAWSMGFAEATRSDLQRIAQASWAKELGRISSAANADNPGLVMLLDFWRRGTRATG